jgi:hypothetical protein
MASILKNKKLWIIIAVIVVIIALIIVMVWYKKKKALETMSAVTSKTPVSQGNAATSQATNQSQVFPLKMGSTGNEVKTLQKYLNAINNTGLANLAVDGIFGAKTLQMLQTRLGVNNYSQSDYNSIISLMPNI